MKHEELIKRINEMITYNRCYRGYNVPPEYYDHIMSINNLLGRIKTVLKSADNDYERGISYGLDICRDLYDDPNSPSNMSRKACESYFNNMLTLSSIFRTFDNDTIIERYKRYESDKKQAEKEEAEKPVIGDVVNIYNKEHSNSKSSVHGILVGEDNGWYSILLHHMPMPQLFIKSGYDIRKTGKHFDIQGMLDEIKEE